MPLGRSNFHSWRKAVVNLEASLEDAMRVLDDAALRIVLIVDADMHLMGIMTDGDMRRVILSHQPLTTPVQSVMNAKPRTANINSDVNARRIFVEKHAHHVPLINDEGQLVGLETYFELLQRPERDNWVLLMAGGFGRRLGDLTQNCPKPMLHVGGRPILEQIIESFVSDGFRKFYISLHYLPDVIRNYFGDGSGHGVTIRYVEETSPLGTAGALGLVPDTEGLPMLMMNADVLVKLDYAALLDYHISTNSDLTVCTRQYEVQIPFGVVLNSGQRVTGLAEKPVQKHLINAGIYVVSPDAVEQCKPERRIDMPELIGDNIADNKNVMIYLINDYWIDVGRPDDFARAQRDSNS